MQNIVNDSNLRKNLFHGKRLEEILEMDVPAIDDIDLNDALRIYGIYEQFEDGYRLNDKTEVENNVYIEKLKLFKGITFRLFKCSESENIVAMYKNIDILYVHNFWKLFEINKLYKSFSSEQFKELLHFKLTDIEEVLCNARTTEKYGTEIREYILSNLDFIFVLMRWYEQKYSENIGINRPKAFTSEDCANYLKKYINSEHPSINYLQDIMEMEEDASFGITKEIKFEAMKKREKEIPFFMERAQKNEYKEKIQITSNQSEPVVRSNEGEYRILSFSKETLLEMLKHEFLFNSFIYLFEFVDKWQFCINLTAKRSEDGLFEKFSKKDLKKKYRYNDIFILKNNISNKILDYYYEFLQSKGLRLEDMLKDFYNIYLNQEYNCDPMKVVFPSEHTTFYEKCSIVIGTIDIILKQFSFYVENREIDFERLRMSSYSKKVENIPSLVGNKYIYAKGGKIESLWAKLFADQYPYLYIKRLQGKVCPYKCFYDLLENESVYLSEYEDLDGAIELITELEQENLIKVDNGVIALGNMDKIEILSILHEEEVISQWHYSKTKRDVIAEWISREMLETESSLFARKEAKYFNLILNRSMLNSFELRNLYAHGVQQLIDDENVHHLNYIIFMKVIVLITIKIYDDFWIDKVIKNEENS